MSTEPERGLLIMLANVVAILADDAGRDLDAEALRNWAMSVKEAGPPDRAARQALMWCVVNDGECLSDHPALLRKFREILGVDE